ncbi:MAG: T9SS type A sorting domain-containing protein [Bacteroidetes bacterium]|nr:T9SS type A sorting domain-containing protein [Bacteroidota bacterium]
MKKLLLSILLLLYTTAIFAQWNWTLNFDDTSYRSRVTIDTVSTHNCRWQIGAPQKAVFNSAFSGPNAIVTDILNPYPAKDTSRFIIKHNRPGQFGSNQLLMLDFQFKLNTDTLTDYGMVEASINNGATWINLLTQDTLYSLTWWAPKPVLSGNTNGWVHYSENLAFLTYSLGFSSTILYRFTFISDSIQTNKAGWMMDNFSFVEVWEDVPEYENNYLISIYPNPANDNLIIHKTKENSNAGIQLFDSKGQLMLENKNFTEDHISIANLENGLYFLKYSDSKYFSVKKFIVQH